MFQRRTFLRALTAATLLPLQAQTEPAFEAASVKPNLSGAPTGSLSGTDKTRFSARNVTLKLLITMAYQLRDFQIEGGPSWINSDRFDITATSESKTDWPQMMTMLRHLLDVRFKVVVRHETKNLPIYAIVPARSGLKLHAGACSAPAACGRLSIFTNGLDGQVGMPLFTNVLSDLTARPVVDETGFQGPFDVHLRWIPDGSTPGDRSGESLSFPENAAPSFFTALEEQLGLKLEPRKGPVETIVVERAEKPDEN